MDAPGLEFLAPDAIHEGSECLGQFPRLGLLAPYTNSEHMRTSWVFRESGRTAWINLGDHTVLTEQTFEKLYAMKLNGLAEAWLEQQQHPQSSDLSFDERLAMLVERQMDLERKPRPGHAAQIRSTQTARLSCVFRSKVATRFGLKWPPNSEQSGRFLAAAETGGRHVPK